MYRTSTFTARLSIALLAAALVGTPPAAARTGYTETLLHQFTGADGLQPYGGVARDRNGNLFGAAYEGGDPTCHCGTLWEITASGKFKLLHTFRTSDSTQAPDATPLLIGDALYGVADGAVLGNYGSIYKFDLKTNKLRTLHAFKHTDGAYPAAPLIIDSSGNFYGTTYAGGASNFGTVFKYTAGGGFNALYSFTGGTDGANPGGAAIDTAGNLIISAEYGGINNVGTVVKVSPAGQETALFTFDTSQSGGFYPQGSMVADTSGNAYGTTFAGNGNPNCSNLNGCGNVYEINEGGEYKSIYEFRGRNDDSNPLAGMVYHRGKLYGTTNGNANPGYGSVFELDPASRKLTTLHTFQYGTGDGISPWFGTILRDKSGNLFGTTLLGGNGSCPPYYGCGTVFELTPK